MHSVLSLSVLSLCLISAAAFSVHSAIRGDAFSAMHPLRGGTSGQRKMKKINKAIRPSLALAPLRSTVVRSPETQDRVSEVRRRCREATRDAQEAKGCAEDSGTEWWRDRSAVDVEGGRRVTPQDPLRVIVAGGGVAGLVAASACHAKGMKVAIFEQASQYAPYGGPIQIQSNALRAIERINKRCYDELRAAGTVTADRVSGLKIGYKKGVFMGMGPGYDKGDWLVRFDTLQPALQAGLPATVVVDRPVIQQILLSHGVPEGTVRIKSRIKRYEELGKGRGIKVVLEDGTEAFCDVLVGADGIWSSVRKQMHGLELGADGAAASGAAGGALDDKEARRMAKVSFELLINLSLIFIFRF